MDDERVGELALVIDQGGHGSRAAVCDANGRILAIAERPITSRRPDTLKVELDADELLQSIQGAIDHCLQQLDPEQRQQLRHAALACQRSNVVCWSRDSGEALSPVISWQDRRAGEWLQQQSLDRDAIQDKTGLVANAHYGASKLRWCLDHLPAVAEAHQAGDLLYGPMASFLLYRLLAGQPCYADAVNASRTLLWNWHEGDWDPGLLQTFGLEAECLPRCVPSLHDFGELHWGETVIPMRLVTGDLAAALYTCGQPQSDTLYITAGTGAFLQRPCGQSPCIEKGILGGVVLQDGGRIHYSLEGTVNGAGSAFAWLAQEQGLDNWIELLAQEPAAQTVVFINGVSGLGSPFWQSELASEFIGEGDARQRVFAVLESIVFLLYENYLRMRHIPGPAQRIMLNGGLSQNPGFCRRLASLCGVPVLRLREKEATVKGAARLLSGQLQADGEPQLYPPHADAALQQRYRRWREAMASRVTMVQT